jgi:hypothetical protein
VAVVKAGGRKAEQTSYVLCHQPKLFDWRLRQAKPSQTASAQSLAERFVRSGLRTLESDYSDRFGLI